MIDLQLNYSDLNMENAFNLASSPECGAVSLFAGTTRNNHDGKKVRHLFYEAYDSMALKIMRCVCSEIQAKWPDVHNIVIHHRLGEVPVGASSIIIAISSPHRKDSLEAVHYAIDRIKQIVPIFKKEEYENNNNSACWKQNKECAWSNNNDF